MHEVLVHPEDLQRLLNLWDACEAAERHFHSCQSALFRNFLKSVWDAPNMHMAQERLSAALKASACREDSAPSAGENQPKNSGEAELPEDREGEEDGT